MTPQALRDSLKQLLSSELGTYTLKSGNTTQAIAILNQGTIQADIATKRGVEVVIQVIPTMAPEAVYSGVRQVNQWQVYLMQHKPPDGQAQKLRDALDKLQRRYPQMRTYPVTIDGNANVLDAVRAVVMDETAYAGIL
jgi:hypothetical protein